MTDREHDPRMRQFDEYFNQRNDYTRRDYEQNAAWDVDDLEDWARESGDFDVPPRATSKSDAL